MNLNELLSCLDKVRGNGEQYMACCPAHDDKSPSLGIKEVDGKILLNCMAGCSIDEITHVLGIEIKDLFVDSSFTDHQKYEYMKTKRMSDLWKILNHELHVLLQTVSNRVSDDVLSKDRNFLSYKKGFKPLPLDFWERELQAAKRIKKLIGEIYE